MAFPGSPSNGTKYKEYEYSSSRGAWFKSKDLVVNTFSTNQVCFSGQKIGTSNVVLSGGYYKPLDIDINVGGCFNVSNGVFTAPNDGLYFITWNGLMNANDALTTVPHSYLRFVVNGSVVSSYCHTTYNLARNYDSLSASQTVQLSTGDTLGCIINNNNGAATYPHQYTGMDITFIR